MKTTYFARCVRSAGCFDYEESNVVKIEVGPFAIAAISGPEEACVGETQHFSAAPTGSDASFHWDFGAAASPATATTQFVSTTWATAGIKTVTLTVERLGCSISRSETVRVSTQPSICGTGRLGDKYTNEANSSLGTSTAVSAYPNPFTDAFILETSSIFEDNAAVEVLDMQGSTLFSTIWKNSQLSLQLNMTTYPAGIYFVKIQKTGDIPELLRLIKQN